jgi:hypothetical protein
MNNWSNPVRETNRRRGLRVLLNVPATVSGESPEGDFSEETRTLVVNAHGALITLKAKIAQGQLLQIKTLTSEKRTCRVVYVGPPLEEGIQLGIEFTEPAPDFWHITFPADERPSTASHEFAATKKK